MPSYNTITSPRYAVPYYPGHGAHPCPGSLNPTIGSVQAQIQVQGQLSRQNGLTPESSIVTLQNRLFSVASDEHAYPHDGGYEGGIDLATADFSSLVEEFKNIPLPEPPILEEEEDNLIAQAVNNFEQ